MSIRHLAIATLAAVGLVSQQALAQSAQLELVNHPKPSTEPGLRDKQAGRGVKSRPWRHAISGAAAIQRAAKRARHVKRAKRAAKRRRQIRGAR